MPDTGDIDPKLMRLFEPPKPPRKWRLRQVGMIAASALLSGAAVYLALTLGEGKQPPTAQVPPTDERLEAMETRIAALEADNATLNLRLMDTLETMVLREQAAPAGSKTVKFKLPLQAALPEAVPTIPEIRFTDPGPPKKRSGKRKPAAPAEKTASTEASDMPEPAFSVVGVKGDRLYYRAPDKNIHVAREGDAIFGLNGKFIGPASKKGHVLVELNNEQVVLPAKNLESES